MNAADQTQQFSARTPGVAAPVPRCGRVSVSVSDWLDGSQRLQARTIDLLYVDPPFNSGCRKRSPPGAAILGREQFAGYEDTWPSTAAYVEWLRARLNSTLPALRPSACLLLHVDYRTSHHVRLLLDDLLGPDRFVNHLIWSYGLGGSSPRAFARKHDDILFYCIDPSRYYFDPPRIPATSNRLKGQTKKATDVIDIPSLNNMAAERTGYPTQKPLALLELLIGACCPPDGTVLDPCCGSGTTLVAAVRLGRCAVGFDINPDAVRVTQTRLDECNLDRSISSLASR